MIALESFRNTRREVANVSEAVGDLSIPTSAGFTYDNDAFWITKEKGMVTLVIYNDTWTMPEHLLGDLEAILYQWALSESMIDDDMEEYQRIGTEAAAAIQRWSRDNGKGQEFALAMIKNAARDNAAVCHLHDVCDVNAFLDFAADGEDVANDVFTAAYEVCRAELMLDPAALYVGGR